MVEMAKKRCTAIVLAAGRGSRMGTKVQKQYLELEGKPVLYYALDVFEKSNIIDDILLVVGKGQEDYCHSEIVDKYHFTKVDAIIPGGRERYESVYFALQYMKEGKMSVSNTDGYVFIHDGARPFVDEHILMRVYESVKENAACVVGMPVKDTVKIVDNEQFAKETPERKYLWQVQTPQVFATSLIQKAYFELMKQNKINVTDDAMVVEQILGYPVKLVEGSYKNIKITTPEDLQIAEAFIR